MKYRIALYSSVALITLSTISLASVSAQNNTDAELDALLGNPGSGAVATRGYTPADTNAVRVIGLSDGNKVTIEAPLAKKNNQNITSYFIAWGKVSYSDIMNNANANIGDIKDSVLNTDSIVYTTTGSNGTGNVLRITITIDDVNANQYITIVPQEGTIQGKGIEDYSFNVGNSAGKTTQVLADSNNANLNQAIMNISCTRDENKDQVTVRRDVNTAKNATKVEIAYKTDASQGNMTIKGTPNIGDKSFTFNTDGRGETLIKLKPLASNNTAVGNEVMYTCKSDGNPNTHDAGDTPEDGTTTTTITTVPHTGPKETFAIVLIATLALYGIYRKIKA